MSGLRLSEGLALSWDDDAPFLVDLTGKRPVFRIRAESQKSGRDEILPMVPDFGAWLLATPEAERVGRVFNMVATTTGKPLSRNEVGKILSTIGERAGVKVGTRTTKDPETGRPVEVPKFASAHDLRRAFGSRWAQKVTPSVLKRLMRHFTIATTEAYYVHMDAAEVADELWERFGAETGEPRPQGNISGNIDPKEATPHAG